MLLAVAIPIFVSPVVYWNTTNSSGEGSLIAWTAVGVVLLIAEGLLATAIGTYLARRRITRRGEALGSNGGRK